MLSHLLKCKVDKEFIICKISKVIEHGATLRLLHHGNLHEMKKIHEGFPGELEKLKESLEEEEKERACERCALYHENGHKEMTQDMSCETLESGDGTEAASLQEMTQDIACETLESGDGTEAASLQEVNESYARENLEKGGDSETSSVQVTHLLTSEGAPNSTDTSPHPQETTSTVTHLLTSEGAPNSTDTSPRPQETTPTDDGNRGSMKRKINVCFYCKKETSHLARHLCRCHAEEVDVQEFMQLPERSKERLAILRKIRGQGLSVSVETKNLMQKDWLQREIVRHLVQKMEQNFVEEFGE